MSNRTPEQDMIDSFVRSLRNHKDQDFKIHKILNVKCRAKKFADIEFISSSQKHWIIEAKTNDSKDAPNSVHKIFGELLKETGRNNRENVMYGILIPEDSKSYYSERFQLIDREKFIGFGNLVPIDTVFTIRNSTIDIISWADLYDFHMN